jgi:predicted aldo/keto reductase-like oxidoreductase
MKEKTAVNRRNFLKSSLIGAGAIVASPAVASVKYEEENDNKGKIIYRELGKTGIKLPIISMGVMRADNPNLVRAALNKGIVHLDTAHGYQEGKNEEMLGEILKDYSRDSIVLATKIQVNTRDKKTNKWTSPPSMKDFTQKFDLSLQRLGLDYVDILYVHVVSFKEQVLHKPLLKTLNKLKKEGKTRLVGVSTHFNMTEVINAAVDSKAIDVVLTAYNFKMADDTELNQAIQRANEAGIGIIAMKTMAGGFHDKERTKPVNGKAALKIALANENVHTAIPGLVNFDQLEDCFSMMEDPVITEKEKAELYSNETTASLFCTGCGQCSGSCKNDLPVPDLMRAYMYTYGYHNYEKAQDILISKDISESACVNCDECTVVCSQGFNVAERIQDVSRLKNVPREFFA